MPVSQLWHCIWWLLANQKPKPALNMGQKTSLAFMCTCWSYVSLALLTDILNGLTIFPLFLLYSSQSDCVGMLFPLHTSGIPGLLGAYPFVDRELPWICEVMASSGPHLPEVDLCLYWRTPMIEDTELNGVSTITMLPLILSIWWQDWY